MTAEELREEMIAYARTFIGTPYIWGGNNPITGFDCSGFVLEVLRAVGLGPTGDMNAQQLNKVLRDRGKNTIGAPQRGALLFFGQTRASITHVAICLSDTLMLEAGGGGSATTTPDLAAKAGAFVRVRPISRRPDRVDCLMP